MMSGIMGVAPEGGVEFVGYRESNGLLHQWRHLSLDKRNSTTVRKAFESTTPNNGNFCMRKLSRVAVCAKSLSLSSALLKKMSSKVWESFNQRTS